MAVWKRMMRFDLDQNHWHRVFGLQGRLSLVLLELAGLEATTAAEYLTPTELARIALFSHPKRKREFLGGRIAAKQAVISMAHLDDNKAAPKWLALEIAAHSDGRPFARVGDDPGRILPDISISHSYGLAAAMVADGGCCGIDIQRVTPSVIRVRERFAGATELTILDTLTGGWSAAARLTLLWAAKEALKKAIGTKILPGFLSIKLIGTHPDNHMPIGDYFVFDFILPKGVAIQSQRNTVSVAVLIHEEYGLAFTVVSKRYIK